MAVVAYVLPEFPVLSQTFIGNEIRAVEARGRQIVPIALRAHTGPAQPDDAPLAERTVRLPLVPASAGRAALLGSLRRMRSWLPFVREQRGLPMRSLVWAAARVAAVARHHRCTHLHAHFAQASAATAIVAGGMAGLPVSFTGHGYDVYAAPVDLGLKLRHAQGAVAVCADMADDFCALSPDAVVHTVHCGVDPERFRPAERPRGDLLEVLFVGRLVDSKGADDLITALAMLGPDLPVRLTLVGDGPERDALFAQARALGLGDRVRFLGARPSAWLAEHGPSFDLLAAPFRVGRNGTRDTSPLVAKEALAMGLPVLASRFMGLREIVSPECGLLVEPGAPDALASGLRRLSELGPAARCALGVAGRARVMRAFTLAGQAERLDHLFAAR